MQDGAQRAASIKLAKVSGSTDVEAKARALADPQSKDESGSDKFAARHPKVLVRPRHSPSDLLVLVRFLPRISYH
jgi:hypothetical protein